MITDLPSPLTIMAVRSTNRAALIKSLKSLGISSTSITKASATTSQSPSKQSQYRPSNFTKRPPYGRTYKHQLSPNQALPISKAMSLKCTIRASSSTKPLYPLSKSTIFKSWFTITRSSTSTMSSYKSLTGPKCPATTSLSIAKNPHAI
jgi:hypothetical protein